MVNTRLCVASPDTGYLGKLLILLAQKIVV